MEIKHRISDQWDDEKRSALAPLGIVVADVEDPLLGRFDVFEIAESDPRWREVKTLVEKWDSGDFVFTVFTNAEKDEAAYLDMGPDWHHGYPQPSDDFEFRKYTYDLTNHVTETGIGYRQVAPFRMKSEPRWGRRHILQLNWVFDVFFARPAIWRAVFKPFGIESMPVLKHSTGKPLETVVQLKSQGKAPAKLDMEGYPYELCERSGQRKYRFVQRGFIPRLTGPCDMHYFESQEWFGSGIAACRLVIVSNELYRAITKNRLRGAVFSPLAS